MEPGQHPLQQGQVGTVARVGRPVGHDQVLVGHVTDHEGWWTGQQPSSGGLSCADGSQTWSPLGPAPAKVQTAPGQAITSARPTDLVISRSRQQIDPSTHLARARGLEPLTGRLDVDVATSAHPDQPRMLAASKPPCQPTPDRSPARQVQARVAAGRFPGHLYAGALPAAGRTGQVE